MAVVAPARADCDVPESGVAEDAVPVDFAGVRKSLAESGVAIGGYYAAETFGNPTGGFKQGATYDGVLELHLNADLNKLGLWKGLCFYTDAFQIHGRSITADYVHAGYSPGSPALKRTREGAHSWPSVALTSRAFPHPSRRAVNRTTKSSGVAAALDHWRCRNGPKAGAMTHGTAIQSAKDQYGFPTEGAILHLRKLALDGINRWPSIRRI